MGRKLVKPKYLKYSLEQRIFIYDMSVKTKSWKGTQEMFKAQYPELSPPHRSLIKELVHQVHTAGNVTDTKIHPKKKKKKGSDKNSGKKIPCDMDTSSDALLPGMVVKTELLEDDDEQEEVDSRPDKPETVFIKKEQTELLEDDDKREEVDSRSDKPETVFIKQEPED